MDSACGFTLQKKTSGLDVIGKDGVACLGSSPNTGRTWEPQELTGWVGLDGGHVTLKVSWTSFALPTPRGDRAPLNQAGAEALVPPTLAASHPRGVKTPT